MRSRIARGRGPRVGRVLPLAGALALVVAACGSDDEGANGGASTPGVTTTPTTTGAGVATTGGGTVTTLVDADIDPDGVLRIGATFLNSGSYNFDSRLYLGHESSFWLYQLYAPLVKVDPVTRQYTPYLAESFEVVDPQTLSVTIRSDATFHDGRPVTAADAKASIEDVKNNQETGSANVNAGIQGIDSIDVVDERTFTVHFGAPAVLTMYELLVGPEFLISPANAGPEQATEPIGNGPFKFLSHVQDQSFEFEKYDEFFDADSVHLAGLRYLNLPDPATHLNAVLAGDVDIATRLTTEGASALEGRDGVESKAILNDVSYMYLTFCAAPGHVWENPDLLRAADLATDRAQVAEVLFGEYGRPLNQFYPEGHPYHDDALDDEFGFDLSKAQAARDAAGLAGPVEDGMWAPDTLPDTQDLALLLDAQWSEVDIHITPVATDDLTGDALQPSKTDPPTLEGGDSIIVQNTRSGLQRLTRQVDLSSNVNTCNWSNARMSEIATELAALAPDDPDAAALWKEASRIIHEAPAPFMILAQKPAFVGVSDRIVGVDESDFRGATEGTFQFQDWAIAAS